MIRPHFPRPTISTIQRSDVIVFISDLNKSGLFNLGGVLGPYDRGELKARTAKAIVANLPGEIAKRELKKVKNKLGWSEDELQIRDAKGSHGPGNILTLELEHDHVIEVFTGFGEVGRPAEAVANQAIQQCQRYMKSDAVAGEYLTDQLMLPLAIAGGGSFTSTGLSRHATTHLDLISQFFDIDVSVTAEDRYRHQVSFTSR